MFTWIFPGYFPMYFWEGLPCFFKNKNNSLSSKCNLHTHNTKGGILACHNLKQIKIFYPWHFEQRPFIWRVSRVRVRELVVTNCPDEGPLLETSRIEYFYLFQIVASKNPSLGVVLLHHCLYWTSLIDDLICTLWLSGSQNFNAIHDLSFICPNDVSCLCWPLLVT